MSVFHNAATVSVRFCVHEKDGSPVECVVAPGDECSVPDICDHVVRMIAPQMQPGPAPEPAAKVSPPPKDPKKAAEKPAG